jgi:dynein heavy chain
MYDYYPNFKEKKFLKWDELNTAYKYDRTISYFNIVVPTSDTVKYKFMLDNLVLNGHNFLLCGETGVGKSVMINDFVSHLNPEKYVFSTMNFSA